MTSSKMGFLAVGLLFLIASVFALRWMSADLLAAGVQRDLQSWQSNRSIPDLASWEAAQRRLHLAQLLNRNEPSYFKLAGDLFERRIYVADAILSDTEIQSTLEQSAESYRQAINLRPVWPDAWLLLVQQKAALAQFDGEFTHALEMATNLGSWNPDRQLSAMAIAIKAWPFLPDETRGSILQHMERGLTFNTINYPNNPNALNTLNNPNAINSGSTDNRNSRLSRAQSQATVARFADLLTQICPSLDQLELPPRVIQHCLITGLVPG